MSSNQRSPKVIITYWKNDSEVEGENITISQYGLLAADCINGDLNLDIMCI